MALLGRASSGALALLLLGLFFMYRLHLTLASSGGVMGGSFFHSDSSSSDSFTSDSETVTVAHDSPFDADEDARGSHGGGAMLFVIFTFGLLVVGFCKNRNGNAITVLKLQVAMLGGKGSSIQRDLTKIAGDADTSSREGVIYLLTETIQTLHQHLGYCIAGYSFVDLKRSGEDGEKCYNQLSNEERAKFDEETLVNLNNKEKISTRSQSVNMFSNEYKMVLSDY